MTLAIQALAAGAILGSGLWLLSFWPRWVAADLGRPESDLVLRPWRGDLSAFTARIPFVSWGFYGFLWRRGRLVEFVLAILALIFALRATSALLKVAGP